MLCRFGGALLNSLEEVRRRLHKPRPGGAVLFTGAGFSDKAKNRLGEPIPFGRDFARQLALSVGSNPNLPLTVSSQLFNRKTNDENAFMNIIINTFTASSIPNEQENILMYPWKRIYTTNYDDLSEHVNFPRGVLPTSFNRNTLPIKLEDRSKRQIVHLNGFVGNATNKTVLNDFLLTLSSYFEAESYSSDWAMTLRQDFLLADIVVFCGYSMYDPNISNLIGANPSIKEKTVIFQREDIDDSELLYLSEFGTVFPIGNDGLCEIVKNALSDGIPSIFVNGSENFEELSLPIDVSGNFVSDRDIDALLVRGIYSREKYIQSSLSGGRAYLIDRSDAKAVAEAIRRPSSTVIIHCEFGNGKTLFVEQVARHLLSDRFRVFVLNRITDNFSFDIEFFSRIIENYVVIIEGIIDNEDLINSIRSQITNVRIIITTRTSAFDLKSSEIRAIIDESAAVYPVDKLKAPDIDSAIKILDHGGYWGKLSGVRSQREKRVYIEKNCKSEISSLLLGLVSSEYLDERLRSAFSRHSNQVSAAERGIVLALCLNMVEIIPTFEFLSELLGVDLFSTIHTFQNEFVREFFAINDVGIYARSPVMSEYILRNVISDDLKIDIILDAVKIASDKHKRAKRYRDVNSKLMQFSFIERVVRSVNNRYERIQDYYDRAGEIGFKEFSPHYWLQYAIAARSFKDFKSADRFFAQTKKIMERRPDFYTYKVDNAYAQFLLESRVDTDFWNDYFSAFVEASTLALNQTRNKRTGLYPYKVASMFLYFFEARGERFSLPQIQQVLDILSQWVRQIESVPRNGRNKRSLTLAKNSVELTVDYLIALKRPPKKT